MHNMLNIIKQAALEAVEASAPVQVLYGTVESASPLSVRVDQRFTLSKKFLVVPEYLTDYTVKIEFTGSEAREATVYNALKAGETVLLLRMQGGQKYVILDRIGGAA